MAKLTCSQRAWDTVRPKSVKKTGLGEAVVKALRALPADTDRLGSLAECDRTRPVLVALKSALMNACTAVSRAKDDDKGAGHLLKGWLIEAMRVIEALDARKIALVDAILDPVRTKWEAPRAELEQKVLAIVAQVRDADQNIGHSEKMLQQAVMAMVERAGTLKEQGVVDSLVPEDYLVDPEFKRSYELWRDMVRVGLEGTRKLELAFPQAKQVAQRIVTMSGELKAAVDLAGPGMQFDSAAIRKFKTFHADAVTFIQETTSDRAARYASFRFIATPDPGSNGYVAERRTQLTKDFERLSKVDAEAFFDGELARHGLNERRLQKTLAAVRAAGQQAQKLAKAAATGDGAAAKALKTLATSLSDTQQRLTKARQNVEVLQALSKDVNRDAKRDIDQALDEIKRVVEAVQEAASERA